MINWTNELNEAFIILKESLPKAPILRLPDANREFILQTDALNDAIGAFILQEHEGINHTVAFAEGKILRTRKERSTCYILGRPKV